MRRSRRIADRADTTEENADQPLRRGTRKRVPVLPFGHAGAAEDISSEEDSDAGFLSPIRKSSRITKARRKKEASKGYSSDDEEVEDDDEDFVLAVTPKKTPVKSKRSHGDPDMQFDRIIACKTQTLAGWEEECKDMNTSEVQAGSRWLYQPVDEFERGTLEERYLIKWKGLSYLHCSWENKNDLIDGCGSGARRKLSTFFQKTSDGKFLYDVDERRDGDYFDASFVTVERILHATEEDAKDLKLRETGRQFFIKWVNRNYSECTWEYEVDLMLQTIDYAQHLDSFNKRKVKPPREYMTHLDAQGTREMRKLYKIFGIGMDEDERKQAVASYQKDLEARVFKNGGKLRDYQAEGVSWLMSNHVNKRSSILADEMGLGKTIQTAAYVYTVSQQLATRGPFLVVAPLSTITHWYREFTGWTDLNTIMYHGSANDRERLREDEFPFPEDRVENLTFNARYLANVAKKWKSNWQKTWMAEVVVTTPEMLMADFSELAAIDWEILVFDEAHCLKNNNSKLSQNLRDNKFNFKHSLLLTGTPIQNNVQELWTLLHIINPDNFEDLDAFMELYGDMSKERVDKLHETIRPYILRRLKEDVEKSVPPKEETLIEVELTVLQKQYYRALYEKNVKFLHRNKKKPLDRPSINNITMQLRKCCNHPFLLTGVEDEVRAQDPNVDQVEALVNASGKLVLLDKLLPRLKADGHRILVFSQFKIMLDILEDYLNLRSFQCERIDGSIRGLKRQAAIDRFQSKETAGKGREQPFIMLLSTRAGGVGINLTAADTCIIFDSDWNPQNDLQAQARCHRIGQTKNVKIYRLLTRKTYEMQMFHMSSMKMGLDQAVLHGIENSGDIMTKEEVEKLLKRGAYDIFVEDKDGTSEKASNDFVLQDIDSILARRAKTVVRENTGSNGNAPGGSFSKASFKSTTSDGGSAEVDVDDPDFWTKVVGEAKEEEEVEIGKRRRVQKSYSEREYLKNLDRMIDQYERGSDADDNNTSVSEYSNDSGEDGSIQAVKSSYSDQMTCITKAMGNLTPFKKPSPCDVTNTNEFFDAPLPQPEDFQMDTRDKPQQPQQQKSRSHQPQQRPRPSPQSTKRRLQQFGLRYDTPSLGLCLYLHQNTQMIVKSVAPAAPNTSHIKQNDRIVGIDGQLFDPPIAGSDSFHAAIGKLRRAPRPMTLMLERWVTVASSPPPVAAPVAD